MFNPTVFWGQTTFFNSYGGQGNDHGKSIITTIDTAYAIVGATESFGSGNTDMYLFKIDSLGNLLWSKTYGGSNVDWGMDLKQTVDTGYILTGYSNSDSWDYDIYVVKTNSVGDSLWTNTYGGNDWDFSYSIATTIDSGYHYCWRNIQLWFGFVGWLRNKTRQSRRYTMDKNFWRSWKRCI